MQLRHLTEGCSRLVTDFQYGPGFPTLGLLNPWVDVAYLGHAWHMPHPAFVKGKLKCFHKVSCVVERDGPCFFGLNVLGPLVQNSQLFSNSVISWNFIR